MHMKMIGLLGGMSWKSTAEYYRVINEQVNKRLGGLHSAKIAMVSLDFEEIERLQHEGRWDEATGIMIDAAKKVEKAGPTFVSYAPTQCIRWPAKLNRIFASPSSTSWMPPQRQSRLRV